MMPVMKFVDAINGATATFAKTYEKKVNDHRRQWDDHEAARHAPKTFANPPREPRGHRIAKSRVVAVMAFALVVCATIAVIVGIVVPPKHRHSSQVCHRRGDGNGNQAYRCF